MDTSQLDLLIKAWEVFHEMNAEELNDITKVRG
jgi:hypothetical protein